MKKRILSMAASVLMLATLMPTQVSAASANEKKLNKVTASNFMQYDTGLPTGGKATTASKINKTLNKIKYKVRGKGNATYYTSLYFYKSIYQDYTEPEAPAEEGQEAPATKEPTKKEKYTNASISKGWSISEDNGTYKSYSESKQLINYDGTKAKGTTDCNLHLGGKKKYTSYSWKKGAKTGTTYSGKYGSGSSGKAPKMVNCQQYPDVKVLGEKCFVYSYQYANDTKTTRYSFVSRKNGQTKKTMYVSEYGISTNITFDTYNVKKADSFFSAPKKVKFKKASNSVNAAEEALLAQMIEAA